VLLVLVLVLVPFTAWVAALLTPLWLAVAAAFAAGAPTARASVR